jgi:hypothetical protein
MRNVVAQKFTKGINARLPIDRFDSDPQRLHTLQNARLSSRDGNTYYAKRIEGASPLTTEEYPVVLDILSYKNFVVVLFKKEENSEFHYVDIVNVANPEETVIDEPFVYSGTNTRDIGKLVLIEDTILISPHNKMLNYIFDSWNFNDFVSTTPTISTNLVDIPQTGSDLSFYESEIVVKSGVLTAIPPALPSRAKLIVLTDFFSDPFSLVFNFKPSSTEPVFSTTINFPAETNIGTVLTTIVGELNSIETFSNLWIALVVGDSVVIEIEDQANYGPVYNDLEFSIVPISGIDPAIGNSEAYQAELNNSFFLDNPTICTTPSPNKKCTKTFGGLQSGTYGSFKIKLGQNIEITTKEFVAAESADDISAEILSKLTTELQENGGYVIDAQEGSGETAGFYIIRIKAIAAGGLYNLIPVSLVFSDIPFFQYSTKILNQGKNIVEGDLDTTKVYWYKARNVYFDGHKTKSCFPVYTKPEKTSDNIEIVLNTTRDIDGSFAAIEIFRKSDEGDFFFLKKIKPQNTDPTQDYFVLEGDMTYRYIYTTSENFPIQEGGDISFELGDYRTENIEFQVGETENSFLEKIFNAFNTSKSFKSKWVITMSQNPKGVVIASKNQSSEYNFSTLTATGSLVRTTPFSIGSVTQTQTNSDQLIITTTTPSNLFKNDKLKITQLNGDSFEVVLSSNFDVVAGVNVIPLKENFDEVSEGSSVSFISGVAFSDYGIIESVNSQDPFVKFYDTGFKDIYSLDERDYVWSKNHYTHDIARDRYVRANVDYNLISEVIPDFQFILEETETQPQNNNTPFYTNTTIYGQARFKDGTTSFFEEITRISTLTESETISITQTDIVDETIKEYAFYAQYKPKNNPFIQLNAASFANVQLPTEFSSKYAQDESGDLVYVRQPFFPPNPRFFVGFGRIFRDYSTAGGSTRYIYSIPKTSAFEWLLDEQDNASAYTIAVEDTTEAAFFPDKITVNYFGLTLDYVKESQNVNSSSYVLLPLIGLKTLSEKVTLSYEIQNFDTSGGFGGATKDEIINRRYRLLGYELIKDPSEPNGEYDGALFIRLEGNTALDRVQSQITKKALGGTDTEDKDTHSFNLNIDRGAGIVYENVTFPNIQGRLVGAVIDEMNIFGIDEKIDAAVYLGNKLNQIDEEPIQLRTGYDTDNRLYMIGENPVNVYFSKLQKGNIYSTLFLQTEIPYQKEKYPNQIIWSDPFVLNSNASGYRNFRPDAFLNIGADYGKIVGIEYVNNKLLVFTEHALAIVNVGEVLTQQVGGEVFVDSSTFLNGYSWALTQLPYVMPKTIVQYENTVFFCDGQDVWMYDGRLKNISEGAVKLNGLGFGNGGSAGGVFMGSTDIFWGEPSRYMGEDGSPLAGPGQATLGAWVGAIDPFNKEYRITDSFLTYAYSLEFGEWFGPYTYKDQGSSTIKNIMVSVVDDRLVLQNTGSVFVEDNYETIIESVANLLDRPDMVKIWRKFYVDIQINGLEPSQYNENFINFEEYGENQTNPLTENFVTFSYRKHKYLPFEDVDLAFAKIKNNSYNIGIVRAHQNSEKLYWKISTNQPDFVLKMIAFEYMNRQRI